MNVKRVVSWFSCGATSAIATKFAIGKYKNQYPIVVAYCDTGSEHPDNERFLKDCEEWFRVPITILKSEKYTDIYDVFDKTRYMAGINGARCSLELKKCVRQKFEDLEGDLQVFGFDNSEKKRSERFLKENPLVNAVFPLIETETNKGECLTMLRSAGIRIPTMYLMGYKNNNCIGCVKGAKGYWNKIRKDFPEIFQKTAEYEEMLGAKLNMMTIDGKPTHITLKELPEDAGNYKSELPITCGFVCE